MLVGNIGANAHYQDNTLHRLKFRLFEIYFEISHKYSTHLENIHEQIFQNIFCDNFLRRVYFWLYHLILDNNNDCYYQLLGLVLYNKPNN